MLSEYLAMYLGLVLLFPGCLGAVFKVCRPPRDGFVVFIRFFLRIRSSRLSQKGGSPSWIWDDTGFSIPNDRFSRLSGLEGLGRMMRQPNLVLPLALLTNWSILMCWSTGVCRLVLKCLRIYHRQPPLPWSVLFGGVG